MRIQGDAGSLRCNHAESLDHATLLTVGREARFAGMKDHRLEAGQLSVAGPNPIRQRMGTKRWRGPGLSTVLLATRARWAFVLLLGRTEEPEKVL